MRIAIALLLLSLAILLASGSATVLAADGPGLRVDSEVIEQGLLHGVRRVSASADVPTGMRAIFRLVGPSETLRLRTKTRLRGFIWANTGERTHVGVPAVLLIHGWPRMPSEESIRRNGLGWNALIATILPPNPGPEDQRGFRELIELKEVLGLYGRAESQRTGDDGRAIVEFELSDASPPGEYAIEVHILDGVRLVATDSRRLVLRRSATVVTISRMARDRSIFYAIAAVLGAIGAGLLAGLVIGIRARRRRRS
jgi:Putative transmembrane protein (Alph_Pro_TM)